MPSEGPEIDARPGLRAEVRKWLDETLDPRWRARLDGASEEDVVSFQMQWMKAVAEKGFAVPTLPREYGGAGLSFDDHIVIIEELARADTPPLDMFMVTQTHVPTTLLEWGTPEQKRRYLPGVAAGELWCQGFSEPNAGSDLAALRTRAVRDDDCFVVNGQKIWSSFSRHARYCLLLARTDPDASRREGISYLIMDMDSAGVEVRPIRQATGNAEFSEIFLSDVRIPAENLIGPVNRGWQVAQSTLAAERGTHAFERIERLWHHLLRILDAAIAAEAAWMKDPQKMARLASHVAALRAERQLIRSFLQDGGGGADAAGLPPVIKIAWTRTAQQIAEFMLSVGEMPALLYRNGYEQDHRVPMYDYLFTFGNTIAAGTNEVMRNLIAERVLEMPR